MAAPGRIGARALIAARVVHRPRASTGWAPLLFVVASAWAVMLLADVTGIAPLLHHHALISNGGPPLPLATLLVVGGWLVMVAGMMLPASSPAILIAGSGRLAWFLLAYVAIWLGFGLAAFIGDVGVHAIVHASPWLLQRPWLISVAVLAIAGIYQFAPIKHRALDACRHPRGSDHGERGFVAGWRHGLDCLRSSWALMLLMFAAGFAGLGWMLALTGVMGYEALGRHGHGVAIAVGIGLLALAGATMFSGLTTSGFAVGPF
jgi:predicted metal-binding membrane protein